MTNRTFRVFVSSTSEDLKEYRAAAQGAVIQANFLPKMMEYFTASDINPALEECLERVAKTDVVVVLVAHRTGWVPKGEKSITRLECEKAEELGKNVLAFLVDDSHPWPEDQREEHAITIAVREGKATPKKLMEVQQNVNRLKDFKEWLNNRGIRAKFTTPEDLWGKVYVALNEWKQQQKRIADLSTPAITGKPDFPEAYREWVNSKYGSTGPLSLDVKRGQVVQLDNVYVPLTTSYHPDPDQQARDAPPLDSIHAGWTPAVPQHRLLLEVLSYHSLYLSGVPGSGKSTFCRWVAWLTCHGYLPSHPVPPPEDYVENPSFLDNRLPLLVLLRDFWESLPVKRGRSSLSRDELEKALADWLNRHKPPGLDWPTVKAHLDQGTALLIMDGVDEVPLRRGEGKEAWHPLALLLSGLSAAIPTWTGKDNRVLVTSRPNSIDEASVKMLGIPSAPISDLGPSMQHLLVHRWFHILAEDPATGAKDAAEMLGHVAEREELGRLTANPMLLTAMCVIYTEGKRLPQDKYDLYNRIVDQVLYNRFSHDPGIIKQMQNRLSVVAYGMHTGSWLDEDRETPIPSVTYDEINRMMARYEETTTWTEKGFKSVESTRERLLSETGLLLPQENERASFYHRSFQEFLAGLRLLELKRDNLLEVFTRRAAIKEWHNTLSFVYGAHLEKSEWPERSITLLEDLILAVDSNDIPMLSVVGDCLQILHGKQIHMKKEYEEKYVAHCQEVLGRDVSVRDRCALWRTVGRLGDPRIVTDLRKEEAYVEVKAGVYPFGDDKRFELKAPILMSRYPVTNSQYGLFIKEGGYENPEWWSEDGNRWREEIGIREPANWRSGKWNVPNLPVVCVSFWEAEAFALWSNSRLPTEMESVAAAQGPEGFIYPWGNEWEDGVCNTSECGLKETSPVGIFPRSRSKAFGLEDMAGNVLEWCNKTNREEKVAALVRGGSWSLLPEFARASEVRKWNAEDRLVYIGFRVVR